MENLLQKVSQRLEEFKSEYPYALKLGESILWKKIAPKIPKRILAFDYGLQKIKLHAYTHLLKIKIGIFDSKGELTSSIEKEEIFDIPPDLAGSTPLVYATLRGLQEMWFTMREILDSLREETTIMLDGTLGVFPEVYSPYRDKALRLESRFRNWGEYLSVYEGLLRAIVDVLRYTRENDSIKILGVIKNSNGRWLTREEQTRFSFFKTDVQIISLAFPKGGLSRAFALYPEKRFEDGSLWFDEESRKLGSPRKALIYKIMDIARADKIGDPREIAYNTVQRKSAYLKTMEYTVPPLRLEFPAWYGEEEIVLSASEVLGNVREGERIPEAILMADLLSRVRREEGDAMRTKFLDIASLMVIEDDSGDTGLKHLIDLLFGDLLGDSLSHIIG